MLDLLKKRVFQANMDLVRHGLVTRTWGNVSGIDRSKHCIVIKPSGVEYEAMTAQDMAVVDMDGNVVDGNLRPSSDLPTHIELYKAFPEIGGIAHTHSVYGTMFAQACREIPCLGTTHADHFNGPIPVTRILTEKEVGEGYERATGKIIIERFAGMDPMTTPGVLVAGHAPFVWGRNELDAFHNSLILERVAQMALGTFLLNPDIAALPLHIQAKHYQRKHGPHAYYGQKK
ncbi:MAG TPA: L-ribulose-5-phosphate 4-epimerase AraD [Acidobacteriota bacterium]|nr:L-ribulose-5-phosphate 4-epimerase AraD [Acidobacteriota bacterium]